MIVTTGTTILFPISAFSAQLLSFEWRDVKRAFIENSSFDQTARTFRPETLTDAGIIEGQIHFNFDQPPPLEGSAERVKITFPDYSTWTALMFVQSFKFDGELDNKIVATVELKIASGFEITEAYDLVPVINDDSVTVVNDTGDTVYTPF